MKKYYSVVLSSMILVQSLGIQAAFAFSDISENHKNAIAITYLKENDVIEGYKDGTFKPNKKVNRAEFLKIVLEGSKVELNSTAPTGFLDISENAWYGPYIRKAKAEKWIEGYGDGAFRPEATINKVEALKILGEVQAWKIGTKAQKAPFKDVAALVWFATYVEYAKNHEFLEETGSYFQPEEEMSRAKISETIYRTMVQSDREQEPKVKEAFDTADKEIVSEKVETETLSTQEEPKENKEQINFIPNPAQTNNADFFNKILLENSFPSVFYKNEIYSFKGKILSGEFTEIFAFVTKENDDSKNTNFTAKVEKNQFSIDVLFSQTGNFTMGIIPGNKGSSKIVNISVLGDLPAPSSITEQAIKADSLDVTYKDDKTVFSWKNPDELTKVLIYQNDNLQTYIFRQKREDFTPKYKDFSKFNKGTAFFKIKSATLISDSPLEISSEWKESETKNIEITVHEFSEIHDEKLTYSSIPDILSTPRKIEFSGTAKQDLLRKAAIILPSGKVETVQLSSPSFGTNYGSETIPKNNSYTFEYTTTKEGTYIVELNETAGYAVINKPIYVGNVIPLKPDFFDEYESPALTSGNVDIVKARNELLALINGTRKEMGLTEVAMSDELNTLSQKHTEDMIEKKYFAHYNPEGQTPDDRRKALGIMTEVGENLAKTASIEYAHVGLMRSAIHRENIIDPTWTRVGLGINKDTEGYYIITEEFSIDPIQAGDLSDMEEEILTLINDERVKGGTNAIISNPTLTNLASQWSLKMVQEDFLGFEAPSGELLIDLINDNNIATQVQAFVVQSSNLEGIKNKILEDTEIANSQWQILGQSLKLSQQGDLRFTLLYTP